MLSMLARAATGDVLLLLWAICINSVRGLHIYLKQHFPQYCVCLLPTLVVYELTDDIALTRIDFAHAFHHFGTRDARPRMRRRVLVR